jgi:hypothetical protein
LVEVVEGMEEGGQELRSWWGGEAEEEKERKVRAARKRE